MRLSVCEIRDLLNTCLDSGPGPHSCSSLHPRQSAMLCVGIVDTCCKHKTSQSTTRTALWEVQLQRPCPTPVQPGVPLSISTRALVNAAPASRTRYLEALGMQPPGILVGANAGTLPRLTNTPNSHGRHEQFGENLQHLFWIDRQSSPSLWTFRSEASGHSWISSGASDRHYLAPVSQLTLSLLHCYKQPVLVGLVQNSHKRAVQRL
jgi:hypothetical protein